MTILFRSSLAFVLAVALSMLYQQGVAQQVSTGLALFADKPAYSDWMSTSALKYTEDTFLPSLRDENMGMQVFYSTNATHLHLAMVVAEDQRWVGFGIAEAGGMLGADIVLYESAHGDRLTDAHVLDVAGRPIPDDCQNWDLVNVVTQDGVMIVEGTRLLDTADNQDRPIVPISLLGTPERVIGAWGDSGIASFHGSDKVAKGTLRFLDASQQKGTSLSFADEMASQSEGSFKLLADGFEIPANETTYQIFCFSTSDMIQLGVPLNDTDVQSIGILPIVDPAAMAHVHHFIVYGEYEDFPDDHECNGEFNPFHMTYAWAPGDEPMKLPRDVGIPVGGTRGFQAFYLEIHYDNPTGVRGVIDNSGIEIFYTTKPREHALGIWQIGDPWLILENEQVGNGVVQHQFECAATCTEQNVDQPLTVLRESLHMHKSGASMREDQIRDGQVIRSGLVEYWDFDQQGGFTPSQEPFQILPGDRFRTSCVFDSKDGEVFGLGSEDEMCIGFIFYYPRVDVNTDAGEVPLICGVGVSQLVDGCEASHRMTQEASAIFQSNFGEAPAVCPVNGVAVDPPAEAAIPEESSASSWQPQNKSFLLVCVPLTIMLAWMV